MNPKVVMGPEKMPDELTRHELAAAKSAARRLRVRIIRRRVATGAAALVAVFSGLALFRSLDQTTTTGAVAATGDESKDEGSALHQVVASVFSDDDHESEHDSDHDHESDDDDAEEHGSNASLAPAATSQPSTSVAPVTTSQS